MEQITKDARLILMELIAAAKLQAGELLVIGCSSSEVVGKQIGKGFSMDAAEAMYAGFAPVLKAQGIRLAVQCCEHLNRALIVEKETAQALGLQVVNVVPSPDAGGAFATHVYQYMASPVAVEQIRAQAGLDIGGTLIGMHLQQMAVPVRLSISKLGKANILCARTRPKYIGGPRAHYL